MSYAGSKESVPAERRPLRERPLIGQDLIFPELVGLQSGKSQFKQDRTQPLLDQLSSHITIDPNMRKLVLTCWLQLETPTQRMFGMTASSVGNALLMQSPKYHCMLPCFKFDIQRSRLAPSSNQDCGYP